MRAPRTIRPRTRKGPLPFRYVLLLSFVIFIILTVQGLWIVDQGIRPTLIHIATTETKVIATKAISDAVNSRITEELNQEDLFIQEYGEDGTIRSIQFNTQIYNQVVQESQQLVQNHLKAIERGEVFLPSYNDEIDGEGGIVYRIPLGQATKNVLLAQLGPQIPVRFSAIGDVQTDLDAQVINTGINNTTIQVNFHIEVDVKIVIPFATNTEAVSTTIPIGLVTIPGEVPDVYSSGGGLVIPSDISN
ncbi:sporulation protein YunB [Halalkalibacter sp. APA_J-10(15)]|uniref:sporulation protein YunB n=1 Tax=unclassified Halalkalibacter TaxID=2893063 RepID=UPI001FF3FB48|nr:sporulation protein YunB [Halalkalibacter sp. APA_J-10(15)]MCK0472738.1 sporulation protein YunB [Halalkalibacter sp. APA_J-10(15)]